MQFSLASHAATIPRRSPTNSSGILPSVFTTISVGGGDGSGPSHDSQNGGPGAAGGGDGQFALGRSSVRLRAGTHIHNPNGRTIPRCPTTNGRFAIRTAESGRIKQTWVVRFHPQRIAEAAQPLQRSATTRAVQTSNVQAVTAGRAVTFQPLVKLKCASRLSRACYLPSSDFAGTTFGKMTLAQINYDLIAESLGMSTETGNATAIYQHLGHTDAVPCRAVSFSVLIFAGRRLLLTPTEN